ncbi:MAG: hypothetical protein HZB68_00985 [Candidatus Aenigmarchaeota archaeon]|nr:hypothetical protein [Candidatus Aenigmarchaeota archaeon]
MAAIKSFGKNETREITVKLKKGTYEIGCRLPCHYEAGMRGTITVI